MSFLRKTVFVASAWLVPVVVASAADPGRADLTKRQTEIGDKRVPIQTREFPMNDSLTDKRFPIKMWHAEFNAIGQRRAPIAVGETREKKMIRPNVIEVDRIDRKMAGENRRMAYVRNFDNVQERRMVAAYRDADVVTVEQMSRPASAKKQEPLTMRELNRFSFQRNHSDSGGPKVDQAASSATK